MTTKSPTLTRVSTLLDVDTLARIHRVRRGLPSLDGSSPGVATLIRAAVLKGLPALEAQIAPANDSGPSSAA
jgi:hypothetical protein